MKARAIWKPILFLFVLAGVLIESSCYYKKTKPGWEYMPDMSNAISYETNTYNPVFGDSMTMRMPVRGTIPRGAYMPFHFSSGLTGYDSAGLYLHIPEGFVDADKQEGKRLFEIYCAVCHGMTGKGDGPIVENDKLLHPLAPPPSYFREDILALPEGRMFHSVHYGKNLMGAYSKGLSRNQIWQVLFYVKSLQQDFLKSQAPAPAATDSTQAGT